MIAMPRWLAPALLALPLAVLGWTWLSTDRASREGTEWDVPVQGYDPRDLLRGHYVQFQYERPGIDQLKLPETGWGELCLEGQAPRLDRVSLPPEHRAGGARPCPGYAKADDLGSYRPGGLEEGRLYAAQDEAMRLQAQLWDPKLRGMIRIRVRKDGHVTPMRLTFVPRPAAAPAPR